MREILSFLNYWLKIFLLLIYKKIEESRIYSSKIIYDNKYLLKKNKILIYSVHIENKINNYTIKNIKYFFNNGYDIILVVTLGKIKLTDFLKLYCCNGTRLIVRKNFGKDFGSFKDVVGLITRELEGFDKVILQNDSFIGPLYTSDFLSKIELMPFDAVGITESFDQKYHIQSSFILLNSKNSIKYFKEFMLSYKVYSLRLFIIKYGEIGLSQFFINNSVSIGVYAPILNLLENSKYIIFNKFINAQHAFMEELFTEYSFPYLKRDALINNKNNYHHNFKKINTLMTQESKFDLMEALSDR